MKLFVDTANLNDIEQTLKRGFVSGITTNPSLLAKEPKGNFLLHAKKIIELFENQNYFKSVNYLNFYSYSSL